jgi:nucleotide-binding universal stress UspA family protein
MSIVFGTTLAPHCQPLAEVAALLAARMNVQLRLVHVSEDTRAPVVLGTDEEPILGPVRAQLDAEAERLRNLTGADVHPHLAAGAVVDALVSVAEFELASALVLGGGQEAARNLLGATAERASRKSAAPVLTLRDSGRLLAWLRGERPLRILVGADLGRAAEAARAFAATLGRLGTIETEVVYVASPSQVHARLGLPPPTSEHALSQEAEAALLRDLARSAPADESAASLRIVAARGSADAHLVSRADQGDFDLVVVGQRRQSILEQLWYGSIARGVVRAAPVSVACVPPSAVPSKPVFQPPRVVLVGTDLSEVAERTLTQALGMVTEGGTVHVAHVVSTPAATDVEARRAREQAWYALSKLTGSQGASERAASLEQHVLEGAAADALLALAERLGADLIVLGVRDHSAVTRALLGSVAQSVSERTKVPVLLVPLAAP